MFNKLSGKVNKWIWLSSNRKPPKKYEAYLSTVSWWFIAGMMFGGIFIALSGSDNTSVPLQIFGVAIFLIMIIAVIWVGVRDDKRMGKYDAIYKVTMEHWHKKRQEYGMEKTEEVK